MPADTVNVGRSQWSGTPSVEAEEDTHAVDADDDHPNGQPTYRDSRVPLVFPRAGRQSR